MNLIGYLLVLRKRWLSISLIVIIAAACGYGATAVTTPMYSSTAQVFVSAQFGDNTSDLLTGISFTQQRITSYAKLATSPLVLQPVVQSLGLQSIEGALPGRISANVALSTVIIEITVIDESPYRAAQIANAVGDNLTKVVSTLEQPVNGGPLPVRVSVIQKGEVNTEPFTPNGKKNMQMALLIGLALALGQAFLRETLDFRVRNADEIAKMANSNIVGGIAFDADAAKHPLIVHTSPKSIQAESYRQLRTNVQFVEAVEGRKSIVVASSIPSEGKTTTACNLAIALADTGARVLLVDCDFRKPDVHKYMGLEGTVGVTDYLIGSAELDDIIQPWGGGKLSVLPAGRIPPNPSELLGSERMKYLLHTLENHYDAIVIDAAPLLPVTDAAILSKITGGVMLVVAVGKTKKPQLQGAVNHLQSVDGRVLGVVLNKIPTRGTESLSYRYGYGGYGYGYGGYGYGYGEANKQPYGESGNGKSGNGKSANGKSAKKAKRA